MVEHIEHPVSVKKTNPRVITGKVISDKMNKTIVVLVERTVTHPKYKKIMRLRSKIYAHDEHEDCKIGDIVKVRESRPISKTKNWVLIEKVN
ncbi:MAG: 30S ribosomal protein S17 [Legionellales bacterium RIFCSPHIGHO2_12_FULL_42_9]|nr:MAG: 30S ribosomal protein S17 [Legionellales bacterium RIFCSPHIGHO2_12_FULL_42_9]